MRIAFVVNNYPPRVGGVESHVSSLARQLAATGNHVFVYTISDQPGEATEDGVSVTRFREIFRIGDVLGFPVPGTSRRLRRALRRARIDVVSVHTRFFPLSWLGAAAAHRRGIPVIHTEHGSNHVTSDSPVITMASRLIDLTLGRAQVRRSEAVLGVSEDVLAFVRRLSGRTGELFYNAIEPATRPASASADRPGHLVFVGRVVRGKGWDTFVAAVVALRRAGFAVTAEILGDGPEMPRLRAVVADSGCAEVIAVRGRVGPQAVRDALRGATLVNPTLLAEGFQTTLLESIGEGGRVVTYDVPGARVLAEAGAPVVIAEERTPRALQSALEAFLASPSAPAPAGFIDEWTWPARASQFLEVCTQAVGRGVTHEARAPLNADHQHG